MERVDLILEPAEVPVPALAGHASQDEINAIVTLVPRTFRANALWAVPLLIDTARAGGMTHSRRIAYVLATAQHGSHFGARLEETGTGPGADGVDRSFDRYEPGTALGTTLGNSEPGDGARFRGRGFVHVRGRAAYATWSQRLGMPEQPVDGIHVPFFVAHPEALARPSIAAQTLVQGMRDGLFTGIALGYYVNEKKADYYSARRVVGGCEHARDVAATRSNRAGDRGIATRSPPRAHGAIWPTSARCDAAGRDSSRKSATPSRGLPSAVRTCRPRRK